MFPLPVVFTARKGRAGLGRRRPRAEAGCGGRLQGAPSPSPSPTGQLLSSRVLERLASELHHHAPGWDTRAERGRGWAPAAWAPQISLWCFAPAQGRRFPQAEPSPATPTPPCRAPQRRPGSLLLLFTSPGSRHPPALSDQGGFQVLYT